MYVCIYVCMPAYMYVRMYVFLVLRKFLSIEWQRGHCQLIVWKQGKAGVMAALTHGLYLFGSQGHWLLQLQGVQDTWLKSHSVLLS